MKNISLPSGEKAASRSFKPVDIISGIKREEFNKNSRILAVHTGGLQGVSGMNKELLKRNLPQIIS